MASVVALDLSRAGIRAVQIDSPYTDRPMISRFGGISVPEGTIFDGEIIDPQRGAKALKELWKSAGFTTKRVAFGVGNRKVVVREVTLPALPRAQRKASLRYAVEGQIPMDLDDAILDFLPLRAAGDGMQEGLLVASARGGLEGTVAAIEAAGRRVDAIDFSGFSLLRALPAAPGVTRALINVGASSTVVVIATGGTPEFVRVVPSGGDDISRALERGLGIGFAEAEQEKINRGLQGGASTPREVDSENLIRENAAGLIDSIRNTLNFYVNAHRGTQISGIVLSGGGSRLAGLSAVLNRALGLPTTFAEPLESFTVSRRLRASGLSRWALELAGPLGVTVGGK